MGGGRGGNGAGKEGGGAGWGEGRGEFQHFPHAIELLVSKFVGKLRSYIFLTYATSVEGSQVQADAALSVEAFSVEADAATSVEAFSIVAYAFIR